MKCATNITRYLLIMFFEIIYQYNLFINIFLLSVILLLLKRFFL